MKLWSFLLFNKLPGIQPMGQLQEFLNHSVVQGLPDRLYFRRLFNNEPLRYFVLLL